MKRIGILTFHYVDNYGAVLQAYALRKVLNSIEGYTAEIINYIPLNFTYAPYEETENGVIKLREKRELFEAFLSNYCGVDTDAVCKVSGNQYDFYCVGSDQVWNPCKENIEYVFPNLDAGARRFSYAASIGVPMHSFEKEGQIFIKNIKRFDHISMREDTYVDYMKAHCGKECESVSDPTFLLEQKDYEPLMTEKKLYEGAYIFFFWLQHVDHEHLHQGIEFVNRLSRKYELPIIHSIVKEKDYMFYKNGGCMFYQGVEDFLWYMKHASFVVTNSFHGTLFAMQFEIPFYTFQVEVIRCRVDYLKKIYRIEDRVVESYKWYQDINEDVNFELIRETKAKKREESIRYIKKAIGAQ